jgi:hypothetical protein
MHVRLQTWLPMPIQVCINGREYLACRMKQERIGFEQRENCFVRIDDLPRAQNLIDELESMNWPRVLDRLARSDRNWLNKEEGEFVRRSSRRRSWSWPSAGRPV